MTLRVAVLFAAFSLVACSGGRADAVLPISPSALTVSNTIAFLGDSITAGSRLPDNPKGISDPHSQSPTAYPVLVGQSLQVPVVNLGIGGEFIGSAIDQEVPAVPLNAATVVIYLGTNDVTFGNPNTPIVSDAVAKEQALIAAVQARVPTACIALIGLPHDVYAPGMNPYQDKFDAFLGTLARPWLDLRSEAWTQDPSNFISDGVHPNAQGNNDLAQDVAKLLRDKNCL